MKFIQSTLSLAFLIRVIVFAQSLDSSCFKESELLGNVLMGTQFSNLDELNDPAVFNSAMKIHSVQACTHETEGHIQGIAFQLKLSGGEDMPFNTLKALGNFNTPHCKS